MTTLADALRYLALGWSVIPCEVKGKKALVKWQDYQRTRPTEAQVRAWWAKYPNANIAVVTGSISGLVCVDVDTYKGGSPDGLPYSGVRARSAQGGLHFFYKYPEHTDNIPNQVNADTHIDVRGDGGYVLVSPSYVVDEEKGIDGGYTWSEFSGLGVAPDWAIGKSNASSDKGRDETRKTERASWLSDLFDSGLREGERNSTLSRVAGYFYEKRIPRDVALSIAQSANRSSESPLSISEVRQTIYSVYRTAKNRDSTKGNADATNADGKRARFEILRADLYARKHGELETKWSVENWLPAKTIAFAVAPPESYKTWLLFELAVALATGEPFLGSPVLDKGPVIIVQQEDYAGQNVQRLRVVYASKRGKMKYSIDGDRFAWEAPDLEGLEVYFHEDNMLRFDNSEVMDDLEALIVKVGAKIVMVDPLYSAADQSNYMADAIPHMMRLKDIRNKHGCSFLLAHHTKKSAESNAREGLWGSQFLNAFLETGWQMRRVNEKVDNRIVITRHFKSAARPPRVNVEFQIETKEGYSYSSTVSEFIDKEEEGTDNEANASDSILAYYEESKSEGETAGTLAGHLNMSEERIRKALKRLEGMGRIERTNNGVYRYRESNLHG